MEDFTTADDVIASIDKELKELLFYDDNEKKYKPKVCFCCDRIIMGKREEFLRVETLKKKQALFQIDDDLPPSLLADYKYTGKGSKTWMKTMMISQYSCYNSKTKSFLACSKCKAGLKNGGYPDIGICNKFFLGYTPKELEELTDIELAFISPVRSTGHIFTYFGGAKGIKGWHSLLRNDLPGVRRSLHNLERLKVVNTIAVVMSGPFTNK